MRDFNRARERRSIGNVIPPDIAANGIVPERVRGRECLGFSAGRNLEYGGRGL